MTRFSRILAFACCVISAGVHADQVPAAGKLLVATNEVRGPYFAKTVVLLLHHDETGTLGVVVNRPIDASAMESLLVDEDLAAHRGSFYWGGPLSQSTVRALLRTDTPPEDAVRVFDSVYLVDMDEALLATAPSAAKLRFFAGYAGWAAGQLEHELALNSWLIVPATQELVFAEDTDGIWRKLLSSQQFRAAVDFYDEADNAFLKYR